MRKLKIFEHISLDGVIQHSADDNDSPTATGPLPIGPPPAGLMPSMPRRNTSRLTGRRAWNGDRSRVLGRTSSRTFGAPSRKTALT